MPGRTDDKIRCSFCGKTQDQVRKLIAGTDNVYICDDCIELCSEILEEEFADQLVHFAFFEGRRNIVLVLVQICALILAI